MKQIKPILTTVLLLLLLTSISYGWVPPNINSPVLLDETDADPWGEELSCYAPNPCCYNGPELPLGYSISIIINGIKMGIAYVIFMDISTISQNKLESDSILQENGNNFNNTAESGRGISTK